MDSDDNRKYFSQDENSDDDGYKYSDKRKHTTARHRADHYRINTATGNLFITPAHSSSNHSHNTPGVYRQNGPPQNMHTTEPAARSRKKHHGRSRSLSIHIRPVDQALATRKSQKADGVQGPCDATWGPAYNPPSRSCSTNSSSLNQTSKESCSRVHPIYQPVQDTRGASQTQDLCNQLIQNLCDDQELLQADQRVFFTPVSSDQHCFQEQTQSSQNPSMRYHQEPGSERPLVHRDVSQVSHSKPNLQAQLSLQTVSGGFSASGSEQDEEEETSESDFKEQIHFTDVKDLPVPPEIRKTTPPKAQQPPKHNNGQSCSNTRKELSQSTEHVFPFRKSPSGNLRVTTDMVAFESKKVAVLVDDPTKTRVSFKQQRSPCKAAPPPVPPMPRACSSHPPWPVCSPRPPCSENNWSGKDNRGFKGRPERCRQRQVLESHLGKTPKRSRSPCRSRFTKPQAAQEDCSPPAPACYDLDKDVNCSSGTENQCHSFNDFMESLHYRLRGAIHADMKIIIDNKEFPCHSIVLQAYSKYFDRIKRPKELMHNLHLSKNIISAENFPNLMDWFLLDDVSKPLVISHCNVLSLYSAAQSLGIPGLKSQCLCYIHEKIQTGDPSILQMYEEACQKENCKDLLATLVEKLVDLFPLVYKSKQFLKLGTEELITLIDSDHVKIHSELEIYDTALRWLLFDWDKRHQCAVQVMSCVRFGLLSPLQLTQIQHCAQAAKLPDYSKIYCIPEVQQMLHNGLTFSILRENYKARPGEFNKWVEYSKVCAPRPRYNLDPSDMLQLPCGIPNAYPNYHNNNEDACQNLDLSNSKREAGGEDFPSPRIPLIPTSRSSSRASNRSCRRDKSDPTKEHISSASMIVQNSGDVTLQKQGDPALDQIHSSKVFEGLVTGGNEGTFRPEENEEDYRDADVIPEYYKKEHEEAATKIQSHFRGYATRKELVQPYRKTVSLESKAIIHEKSPLQIPGRQVVLLVGGMNPVQDLNLFNNNSQKIYRYDPENNHWSEQALLPKPLSHCGVIFEQGIIYVFGGDETWKNKTPSSESWSLNPTTYKWTPLSNLNIPRTNFGFCCFRRKIYVFGGKGVRGVALNSCERYSIEDDRWELLAPMPISLMSMAVAKFGDKIFVVGGVGKGGKRPISSTVLIYEPRTNSWSRDVPLQFGRCYAQLGTHYEQLYLVGGAGNYAKDENTKSLRDVSVYNDGEWKTVGLLKMARHGHTMVKIGKHFLVLGGVSSESMEPLDTVEMYNTETNRSYSRVANMPQALTGMTAIVV